ncbi:MAG: hypothetical protein M0017_09995 [Desulfobacteraceae bacterium]|nr:hypothetical protein [Desulfobacteraceae bacterium]
MKMNAPFCAGIAMLLMLAFSTAVRAQPETIAAEYERPQEQANSKALRDLMESVMDLYTPALKAKLLSLEKKIAKMSRFSGSIYLQGEKAVSTPRVAGEALVSNQGDQVEEPFVNWSIKTSVNFNSGEIGMELWKETKWARVSFSNEVEQDFSQDLEYKSLIKLEKKF